MSSIHIETTATPKKPSILFFFVEGIKGLLLPLELREKLRDKNDVPLFIDDYLDRPVPSSELIPQ